MEKIRLEDLKRRVESGEGEVLVAVDGKVYDLSKSPLWKTGTHMKRHRAGEDLTAALSGAPHGAEVLESFEPIGELEPVSGAEKTPGEGALPGGFLGFVLNLHPHPMSVHFPIALSMTAALLTALGWLFSSSFLITAGFTNLVIAMLAMPASIGTGFLSFHYNYGHKWTRTFRAKQVLSLVMVTVALIAVLIHWAAPGDIDQPGIWLHTYMIMVLCLVPIVGATGYLGGTITFPR
ncbi:MAG TPA: cytochrome b5 domain-containing protein [bacterium]|nr:cytochrome b5 domain-containing protein [bacterium]